MNYFSTQAGFTQQQLFFFASGLVNFDFSTLDLTNFFTIFSSISFAADISETVITVSNSDSFASISVLINVLTTLRLEDSNFNIATFDASRQSET